jgi:hypothetical protein
MKKIFAKENIYNMINELRIGKRINSIISFNIKIPEMRAPGL